MASYMALVALSLCFIASKIKSAEIKMMLQLIGQTYQQNIALHRTQLVDPVMKRENFLWGPEQSVIGDDIRLRFFTDYPPNPLTIASRSAGTKTAEIAVKVSGMDQASYD
jgi:hypothetical protein